MASATATMGLGQSYEMAIERLERMREGAEPAWLASMRARGRARVASQPFPTTRDEEWRFTNVGPLVSRHFVPAPHPGRLDPADIARLSFGQAWPRLVFVDGRFDRELSHLGGLAGGKVAVSGFSELLLAEPGRLRPHLGLYATGEGHVFRAMNEALFEDGAYVEVPPETAVDEPIHLLFVSTGVETMAHLRTLVVAGGGSRVRLVESYAALNGSRSFTNAVTEIVVGANAAVDHYKLQRESADAFHLSTTAIRLDGDARFASHAVTLGGGLVRNEVNAVFAGSGADCTLNGVYLGNGERLIDNHTAIDHAVPHCTSHEVYKGILDDRARGVFNGKIFVRPDAQKTDAKQTNQVLLLSDGAQIDTKPQLEIFADDVKCTHGATVGQIDEDALFYLQTRGIPRADAKGLLVYAFASDVVSRIVLEPVRSEIDAVLLAQLPTPPGQEAR